MTAYRQILRLDAVMARVGMGRSWIYREQQQGRFPAPVKLGRASGWDSESIEQWIAAKVSAVDE